MSKELNLKEILSIFSERLTDLNLYQRAANATAQVELKYLHEYVDRFCKNTNNGDSEYSLNNMYFRDLESGDNKRYGYRKSSVKDRETQILLHKNKQYCWLLAEAYEEFEDFLECLYAYMGMKDKNSWLMTDFGNITYPDLALKDYEWYLEQAKKKKDAPRSILERIRSLYPKIKSIETNNKLNINLKVAIKLIEKLRHIIVHKGGKVASKRDFVEMILRESGISTQAKSSTEYQQFIERFFGTDNFENVILLLEVGVNLPTSLVIQKDLYGELSGHLIAYATKICDYMSE